MEIFKDNLSERNFSALLTDLDGTLIHSQNAICEALYECFVNVGARVPEKQEILDMFGLPVEVMLTELGNVDKSDYTLIDRFIAEYKRQYPIHMAQGATLIKNAKQTVDAICAAGFPICLITSERRDNATFILERLGLSDSIKYLQMNREYLGMDKIVLLCFTEDSMQVDPYENIRGLVIVAHPKYYYLQQVLIYVHVLMK